jgi:Catalytic LigB subunit of aromatic ring-opening dioxygenase
MLMFRRALLLAPFSLFSFPSTSRAQFADLFNFPTSLPQLPFRFVSNMTTAGPKGAVISLSHGGGPMPVLGDPGHKDIVDSLKTKVPEILRLNTPEAPKAIVVVTAHWSERVPTISNGKKHRLYYDYYGFPPESYKLKYDAPGSPEVAQEVYTALKEAGLKPEFDEERGAPAYTPTFTLTHC